MRMKGAALTAGTFFAVTSFIMALIAHAAAYLTHEYAHTVVAWLFGWMSTPFGISYGSVSLNNVLFLDDVSDNVNYEPIFASGHGVAAALIALAGPFIGNGALYFVLYALIRKLPIEANRYLWMFLYWMSLMCAANVWSYVPIRAITTHADIALGARGLGISTWALLPFVLAPSLFITFHFMTRLFATASKRIADGVPVNFLILVAYTGFWYFSFFAGTDAIDGKYGLISQVLSISSRYLFFPLCVAYLYSAYGASAVKNQSAP